jgi:hypothetical protein
MELSIPASPSGVPARVSDEVVDDVVLARNEATTNAVLYRASGDQPIQVVVNVNDDWVEASVLDPGPEPPAGLPAGSATGELRAGRRRLWRRCCIRCDRVRAARLPA